MTMAHPLLTAALLVLCLACAHCQPPATPASVSSLVHPGPDGKLVYVPDAQGNVIPDFSNCGYMGGGVPIPDVPVKATVEPAEGDCGPRIQAAIDQVSALPLDANGFRGAVLLKRGRYAIPKSITLKASGVVLRGEGRDEDGTVLIATGKGQRTLIEIAGPAAPGEAPNSRRKITDAYVPVGARSFHVERADNLKVGDTVTILRPSTAEWIHFIGMDRIPVPQGRTDVVQWKAGSKDLPFRRVITAIAGNLVTVDAPIVNALQAEYGGGILYRHETSKLISQVGVENLRGDSEYTSPTDEDHGWNLMTLGNLENGWVRNVTSVHFGYSLVMLARNAYHVTVRDCTCLDPISRISGGRRYSFAILGSLNLFFRCRAREGRHDFVMHATVAGPNAFVDCLAEKAHSDTGPHHRWSTGTLYDNVEVQGNAINVQDRGASGTGHGWAGAQMVYWNCKAKSMDVQRPPTAQNWAIGCAAETMKGSGFWESKGFPVQPRSLYLAQLEDRLGADAVVNTLKGAFDTP
jgi:hypothetical protein